MCVCRESYLRVNRCLKHFHEERVHWYVANEPVEKEMLEAFEADAAKRGQPQQQFREPAGLVRVGGPCIFLQRRVHLFAKLFNFLN